ncbi:hypothetical protein LCGC14_0911180 [marine sediment metagenome]|uniref:Uncharacterized protein n=1 Tax=marine sediment metagenome TaxID=412755 RepID=A0A0F9S0G6_9ZZZZ|nr:MAG: hypothetical protein Lokiarch_28390 [Candidatus Lokiarchaeum sp. GC14_75]
MFRINKYITLDLQNGKTVILLGGIKFLLCKGVFVNINSNIVKQGHNTIDEIIDDESKLAFVPLDPEEEFWVHCSNLQAWEENNYDSTMLHSNIAFPLLEELVGLGDPLAKRVFKDEVVRRLFMDYTPTIVYLLKHEYLSLFTDEELELIMLEVKKKNYICDKGVLDMLFINDDFDEDPPIDRLNLRTMIFFIEHPHLNLFELLIKYADSYFSRYHHWIIKFLDHLYKSCPELFEDKINLFLKKGYSLLPPRRIGKKESGMNLFDFSKMNKFTIVLYTRYLRDMKFN